VYRLSPAAPAVSFYAAFDTMRLTSTNRIQSLSRKYERSCREALKQSIISLSEDERTNHE
jgi:hypothetical protein